MIILNSKKIKQNFSETLQNYKDILNYGKLNCPICNCSDYIRWGFYERNVIYIESGQPKSTILTIQRIKCKGCGHTHAIIPDGIIPYKQHNLEIIIDILNNNNIKKTIEIDYIEYIKKQFKNKVMPYLKTTFPNITLNQILKEIKTKLEYRQKYLKANNKYFMQIKLVPIIYAPS